MYINNHTFQPIAFEETCKCDEDNCIDRGAERLIDYEFDQDVRLGTAQALRLVLIVSGSIVVVCVVIDQRWEVVFEPFLVEVIWRRCDDCRQGERYKRKKCEGEVLYAENSMLVVVLIGMKINRTPCFQALMI